MPHVPVYKGLTFRNCGLGAGKRIMRGGVGGLRGPLHMYSLCDTWDATRGPAQPSKVVPNPTPSFLDPKAL